MTLPVEKNVGQDVDVLFRSMHRLNRVLVSSAGSFQVHLVRLLFVYVAPSGCQGYVLRGLDEYEDTTNQPPPMTTVTLASRDTTQDLIHDQFFIPAIASIGAVFLLGALCIWMLVTRKSSRPILPPNAQSKSIRFFRILSSQISRCTYLLIGIVSEMRPHTLRPLSSMAAAQAYNDDAEGRPQSKVQRKPPPAFLGSPNRTPPGTATIGSFPASTLPTASGVGAYTQLRPGGSGVPQHPSLQKYNPEPLPYTPTNVAQTAEGGSRHPGRAGYWAQRDPGMSTPSTDGISSITHLGTGGSDHYQQHQQQGLGPSANTPQSPLSPSSRSTPPQQHQKSTLEQTQQQESREGQVHTHPADVSGGSDYANAYGGIEEKATISQHAKAAANQRQRLPPTPPDYTDSDGALSYLTSPALSAHNKPASR